MGEKTQLSSRGGWFGYFHEVGFLADGEFKEFVAGKKVRRGHIRGEREMPNGEGESGCGSLETNGGLLGRLIPINKGTYYADLV